MARRTGKTLPNKLSLTPLSAAPSSTSSLNTGETQTSIARGGVTTPFPYRLHEMLDWSDKEGKHEIVRWMPHGRSFLVLDAQSFVSTIMPIFFNQSKFASFQRQLNLYGFSRFANGPDKGAYYHQCFVRGEQELCRNMVRQKVKGTKVRRSLSPEEEPNFYSNNFVYPDLMTEGSFPTPSQVTTKSSSAKSTKRKSATKKKRKKSPSSKPASSSTSPSSLVSMMHMDQPNRFKNALVSLGKGALDFNSCQQRSAFAPPALIKPMSDSSIITSSSCDSLTQQQPQSPDQLRLKLPSFHQASQSTLYMDAALKGGDLLFFEGLPFRYIEPQRDMFTDNISPQLSEQQHREKLQDVITNVIAMEEQSELLVEPSRIASL